MKKSSKKINLKNHLQLNTSLQVKVLPKGQLGKLKGGIAASIISVG